MIDHIGLNVSDFERSKIFYEQALAPLGLTPQMEFSSSAGFGTEAKPFFWIAERGPVGQAHVAFHCDDRASVDRFHAAALAAGGEDNGAPGLRPHYHPNYYAAFVHDPDGNNIEVVCHQPQ
jgi:catechol 2,3-dioxygenase-like lactoylglutathione lyase family enzyme